MKHLITLIPQPPKPPAENGSFISLALIMICFHMFILIAFAIMVELTEYKMILLFLIATFEVFFGLGLLNCIHDDSNGYSVVTFRGFFIFTLHGLYSNNLIYYSINQHLFCCTAIWWAFCFGILAINIVEIL
jgi:hypothetical protein